jgi:hypothetical protein
MLSALTKQVSDRIAVLDRFLSLCRAWEEATTNTGDVLHTEFSARSVLASNLVEEKVFRHCSIVTQLYSIYESFSEAVISTWLTRLPRYKSFLDLSPAFRNAYRSGIANIIQHSEKRRYRHLNLVDVLSKYHTSLQGICKRQFNYTVAKSFVL